MSKTKKESDKMPKKEKERKKKKDKNSGESCARYEKIIICDGNK